MPAYYRATLAEFLADEPQRILGVLASRSAQQGFTDLKQRQTRAWERQTIALRNAASELTASITGSAHWGRAVGVSDSAAAKAHRRSAASR